MDVPVQIDVTRRRLPPAVERTAYFIVAEALTNAVKHADATAVEVSALVRDETLELHVRDDGVGGADLAGGTGLVGLTDRVAVSGGTIAITSPPRGGTTLVVTLPMRAPAGPEAASGDGNR
jgi:signal transduction histidine kinase